MALSYAVRPLGLVLSFAFTPVWDTSLGRAVSSASFPMFGKVFAALLFAGLFGEPPRFCQH